MSTSPGARPVLKKSPVSCYIRTLNEERLIKAVIDSALTVVDEVIIVDSGSKDRTIEIAKDCGARVLDQPWLGWGFQKRASAAKPRLKSNQSVVQWLLRRVFAWLWLLLFYATRLIPFLLPLNCRAGYLMIIK
jgi:glycosyltransferase involved in cell wall biosynthesis